MYLEVIEVYCVVPTYFDPDMIARIEANLKQKSKYMCQSISFSYEFENSSNENFTFLMDIPTFYEDKEYEGVTSQILYESLYSDYYNYCLKEAIELEKREEIAMILNRITLKF